jgi:hypothetical protein
MSVTKTLDKITPSLSRIQQQFPKILAETHKKFVSVTPKASGNARNKTKLKGNVISADYAYAKVLDQGLSRQAPQGMVKPTVAFLRQLLRRLMRK